MEKRGVKTLLLGALLSVCLLSSAGTEAPPQSADPLAPLVEEILAAYEHSSLVCLGERHGRALDSKLRIQLVQHPKFAEQVGVIIVEFANAVHQERLDRWIGGEDIPMEQVRWIWRDTNSKVWDSPIYEEFLAAVREVNRRLPPGKRLRVLAGDVPLDWSRIRTWEDMPPVINRGSYPIGVIDREILSQGLKGLAVYGAGHCERWDIAFTPALAEKYPGRIWVAAPLEPEAHKRLQAALSLGAQPALVHVQESRLASQRAAEFLSDPRFPKPEKLGQVVDALVYYGDLPDPIVWPDPTVYEDKDYAREIERRDSIILDWARAQRKRFGTREP